MKYALYTKQNRPEAKQLEDIIVSKINHSKHQLDPDNPDVVICIGGDGTFLEAAHRFMDKVDKISFLPFMAGHLGFYIDFFEDDVDKINELIEDNVNIKEIPLIEAHVEDKTFYAINEFSLGQFAHASAYDIYMNDQMLESYYGSGILFSTTYGSSAYNRSVGGPLIDVELKAFCMNKIAPITSKSYTSIAAPMVFSADKTITLFYKNRHHQTLTCDNGIIEFDYLDKISFKVSNRTIKLHTKDTFEYLNRIRKAC